ncbi:multidrug transporter [Lutibacter sp. HS1-25]|uniref:multidrug transporter n=1 Tax=Lutibacter sp. HS1-25 TaxID=2485000 RepID=UPI0010135657|nr:multidrug transporter [Lutibacter sp. HS1-25]RXP64662.1 multidrug transporter [Lutibacter sp. HS1-25]
MKNTFLTLAIASTLFISCGEDDTADIIINNTDNSVTNIVNGGGSTDPGAETIYISGTYTSNLDLLAKNNYILNGALVMASGTTLSIEAGTTINALASGSDIYIAIAQGAKIEANGTASAPIVMTSNSTAPKAGDWGGLILLGKAPINSVSSGTSTSEIGGLPYGGTNAADNSGTIRYVRVQYSGGKADGQSENNGFSFYGVGNGTTVEYIQMFEGLDDGLEFFGGTVNVNYVSVINAQDDSIDWTEGFSGNVTNAYIKQGVDHDKAFEADGYNTDIGNNASPKFWSAPTITNATVYGFAADIATSEAIRLRAGTKGIFTNIVLNDFGKGTELKGDGGDNPTGTWAVDKTLHLNDITFNNVTTKVVNQTAATFTEADLVSGIGNGTGTDYATWGAGWTVN